MSEITLAELEQSLRRAANVDVHLASVIKDTAMRVAATQRSTVKVASGKTRDSIRATGPGGAPFTPTTVEAEIGPTWFVGALMERGTSLVPPHPFVSNSLDPHLDHLNAGVRAAIDKSLGRLA